MTDNSIRYQRLDRRKLLVTRHFRIDAVQLPKLDLFEPKSFPALDRLLAQVFRTAVSLPHAWTRAPQSALRGDEHAVIRIENLMDEPLGNFWTVGIGGIDEIDPKLEKAF